MDSFANKTSRLSLILFILPHAAMIHTTTSCLYTSLVNVPAERNDLRSVDRKKNSILIVRKTERKGRDIVRIFVALSTCFIVMSHRNDNIISRIISRILSIYAQVRNPSNLKLLMRQLIAHSVERINVYSVHIKAMHKST